MKSPDHFEVILILIMVVIFAVLGAKLVIDCAS